jgi:cation-transporting P-type ATPase E
MTSDGAPVHDARSSAQRDTSPTIDARRGLTSEQVAARVAAGLANTGLGTPSRSVAEIVRANVVTRFNLLIGSLLVVILLVAPLQDALFGLVALTNTLIGIGQELRAKRTLDRLTVISAPRATVRRDGQEQEVDVADLVIDDVLEVGTGDQLAVDAVTLTASGLELDESLVTGESDPVTKQPGDGILSGSFVVAGAGTLRTTEVGEASYAGRLTEEARRFAMARSELRSGIDRILRIVTWVLVPTALLLVISQLLHEQGVREALAGSVAGTIAMIPEGLVLLASLAFAASVIRLGRQGVLAQELPAVETLARVDVVCFDKTGTLTVGDIWVHHLEVLAGDRSEVEDALAALAAADPRPNATLAAIAAAFPPNPAWHATSAVPFSSARKWSAGSFGRRGTWVLGAPDVLGSATRDPERVRARASTAIERGHRVVLLASAPDVVRGASLPGDLEPRALIALSESLRADAAETLAYFEAQGVRTLLISGDHPRTVASIARRVGLPDGVEAVTGSDLPTDAAALADLAEEHRVFARVTPDDKRALVRALQARGHVVAMTGDGVNDVLALKDADIGIAFGRGAPATRNVAQIVLLEGDFATIPHIVDEGRRVIANIERVASLFLAKTVYATLLAVAIGVAQLPFPFLPRHLSLVGGLTIGIPAFFLALEPNQTRAQPGFLRRAVGFAVPAGVAAAVATFAAFWLAQAVDVAGVDVDLEQARTVATVTLFGLGVLILRLVSRPLNLLRRTLVSGAVIVFLLIASLPATSTFFALELPPVLLLLAAIGIVAVAGVIMETVADGLELGARLRRDGWRVGRRARTPALPHDLGTAEEGEPEVERDELREHEHHPERDHHDLGT